MPNDKKIIIIGSFADRGIILNDLVKMGNDLGATTVIFPNICHYLMFRSGIEDMEICDSMETGIISLYNRITARMHADYDVLLEEADIDSIIQVG